MAVAEIFAIFATMESTEERISRLEREFDELKRNVRDLKPRARDWRLTVGMIPDDELSRTAAELGRQWREQANRD